MPNYSRKEKMAEVRKKIENGFTDYFVYYHGKNAMIYSDPGGVSVTMDKDYYTFDCFDEMLNARIFWGYTLEEVVLDIEVKP